MCPSPSRPILNASNGCWRNSWTDEGRSSRSHRRRTDIETTDENRRVRILVAEDNDDLRMVMPALIDGTEGLRCVATTAYLDELAPLIAKHQVEVTVLDIELRGGSA